MFPELFETLHQSGNLEHYLALDVVPMVGGTWVAKKEVVAAQDWDTIRANCRQIHEIVARVRGGR